VGKNVVQEWAEFLEEEGIVTIDYSLSKAWISERKISAEDVVKNAKEVYSEREALARKIDVAITSLDQETVGFEQVHKEFINIQSHIKNEIDTVKTQLSELERYDKLKQDLDKNVANQRAAYDKVLKEAGDRLHIQSDKYDQLKSAISQELRTIDEYMAKLEELKKLRADCERSVKTLHESLKNIDVMIADYSKKLDDSARKMQSFKESLSRADKEASQGKDNLLGKKFAELQNANVQILKNQQDIFADMNTVKKSINTYTDITGKVRGSFDGFFAKNIETEKLIQEIAADKNDLQKELETLKSRVEVFTILSSTPNIKAQIKEIEEKVKSYDARRLGIKYKIEKLISRIKGKNPALK